MFFNTITSNSVSDVHFLLFHTQTLFTCIRKKGTKGHRNILCDDIQGIITNAARRGVCSGLWETHVVHIKVTHDAVTCDAPVARPTLPWTLSIYVHYNPRTIYGFGG